MTQEFRDALKDLEYKFGHPITMFAMLELNNLRSIAYDEIRKAIIAIISSITAFLIWNSWNWIFCTISLVALSISLMWLSHTVMQLRTIEYDAYQNLMSDWRKDS